MKSYLNLRRLHNLTPLLFALSHLPSHVNFPYSSLCPSTSFQFLLGPFPFLQLCSTVFHVIKKKNPKSISWLIISVLVGIRIVNRNRKIKAKKNKLVRRVYKKFCDSVDLMYFPRIFVSIDVPTCVLINFPTCRV